MSSNPKAMSKGHRSKNQVVHHIPIMPKDTDALLATYSVRNNELNVEVVHMLRNQVHDETELHVMFTLNGREEKITTKMNRLSKPEEIFKEMRDFIANHIIKEIAEKYVKTTHYETPNF